MRRRPGAETKILSGEGNLPPSLGSIYNPFPRVAGSFQRKTSGFSDTPGENGFEADQALHIFLEFAPELSLSVSAGRWIGRSQEARDRDDGGRWQI